MKEIGFLQKKAGYITICLILIAVLVISVMVAVTFGTVRIPVSSVYQAVAYRLFGIGSVSFSEGTVYDVVWLIRLPRLILAVAVGMALSVCGLVLQAIVRNPIAEPYVMGISSGAYAGAVLSILLNVGSFLGGNFTGIMACIGAFTVSVAVVITANIGSRANAVKLILVGTAFNSICTQFSNFIIYSVNEKTKVQSLINWNMGTLAGAKWNSNLVVMLVVVICILFFWTQYRNLNLMLLGDDDAIRLGTNLYKWRLLYLLISALMLGFAVYASGMIGFVGLVIPHVARLLFGTNHRQLVPLCALAGAIFLVWADVLCRTLISGTELPIGILTSMIGAPVFLYLMIRRRYSFGGSES